jgi:hypothetical protein
MPEEEPLSPLDGEKAAILAGVDALYERLVFVPDTGLPDPPPNLMRRFVYEQRADGLIALSYDLPEEPAARLFAAFCCAQNIIHAGHPGWVDPETFDFWLTPCDPYTLDCTMTADEVRALYQSDRNDLLDFGSADLFSDFDLHDVYICVEETVLDRHQWRTDYGEDTFAPGVEVGNERYITQLESVLSVIGQAIESEFS